MNLYETLDTVAWGEKHFGCVIAGGPLKLRDIQRAKAKGFVESVGIVAVCDDDGALKQPERYREGFTLTESGKAKLREYESQFTDAPRTETHQANEQ